MKPATPRPRSDTPKPHQSRRSDVRFEPPRNLLCTIAGYGANLTIRNISLGGLGLLSEISVRKGARLELVLTMGPLTVLARGQAVHCERQDDGQWAVGVAFIKDLSTGPNIAGLIDAIANSAIEFS